MAGLLSRERIIAPPGFNRWLERARRHMTDAQLDAERRLISERKG
jgi:hypothetical protein